MDALIPLLLMALFYILPELFKKSRNKNPNGEYEYPQFPDETEPKIPQRPKKYPVSEPDLGLGYDYHIHLPKPAYETSFNLKLSEPEKTGASTTFETEPDFMPPNLSGKPILHGGLSPQIITNGVIFSEIIMKPRAYRKLDRYHNPRV